MANALYNDVKLFAHLQKELEVFKAHRRAESQISLFKRKRKADLIATSSTKKYREAFKLAQTDMMEEYSELSEDQLIKLMKTDQGISRIADYLKIITQRNN
jgi:TRAP-type mannitol/chloroaromatic compound transport system substrate-binding protein